MGRERFFARRPEEQGRDRPATCRRRDEGPGLLANLTAEPRSLVSAGVIYASGGRFGRICGMGLTSVKPFTFGGNFDLSDLVLVESAKSLTNRTCAFSGRFLTADGQSVAAGCCAAGTPSIQIRHMPFGGRASAGMAAVFFALSFGDP